MLAAVAAKRMKTTHKSGLLWLTREETMKSSPALARVSGSSEGAKVTRASQLPAVYLQKQEVAAEPRVLLRLEKHT